METWPMVELCSHPATERAGLVTLHLPTCACIDGKLPSVANRFRGREWPSRQDSEDGNGCLR
jgi:hypothetical protein